MDSNSGKFSIKAFYFFLELEESKPFPVDVVWNPWTLMRMGFFTYEVAWGSILTLDQLKRKGLSLGNRFYMYQRERKFVDHILSHCATTRILWQLVFSLFGIVQVSQWPFFNETVFFLKKKKIFFNKTFLSSCIGSSLLGRSGKERVQMPFVCLFWTI